MYNRGVYIFGNIFKTLKAYCIPTLYYSVSLLLKPMFKKMSYIIY